MIETDESARDERAAEPPDEAPEDAGEADEPAATEAPGPEGNPGVDEEALRNRQQEDG